MSEEKILLENDQAIVSTTRVVIGEKTYALANLNSVSKETAASPGIKLFAALMVIGGGFFLITSLLELMWSGVIAGLITAGIGAVIHIGAQITFYVTFQTSSGSDQVIESTDEAAIDSIVAAVNEAIMARN